MIRRVYERVKSIESFCDMIVTTDDERIKDEVNSFGGHAVLTGECSCGTEWVYEAIRDVPCDIVINVQGDEPLIQKEIINNPNVVKVITDKNENAIYFSRYPIPYNRDNIDMTYYKHIGAYGYTKEFLNKYVVMQRSELEKCENLEQLRVLENDYDIRIKETIYESIGVDLPEHIKRIEEILYEQKQI